MIHTRSNGVVMLTQAVGHFMGILIVLSSSANPGNGLVINEILVSNVSTQIDRDFTSFSGWIELYNSGDQPLDLTGCYLTDDFTQPMKWRFPSSAKNPGGNMISPQGFKLIWVDERNTGLHTNFSLSRKGGAIGLFSSDRVLLDLVSYSTQLPDISWGRSPDGLNRWVYFSQPTPNRTNDAEGIPELKVAAPPRFSISGGFYLEKQELMLAVDSASSLILYTRDGSIPTPSSLLYTEPILIDTTTVIRTRVYEAGRLPSSVITQTYLINEKFTLPVVFLATNPENLWDNQIGIYVTGSNGIIGNCLSTPQNYNQDWERPIHVELYEPSGVLSFKLDGGVKIYGSCSRIYPQKSLAIFAREQYGANEIPYPIFPDKPIPKFKDFALRNGGNDWIRTLFSDAMMQYLVKDQMDIDYQAYRPAIVFLNGEYRGILNLREKLNEHYLHDNHGVDAEQVDLLENDRNVMAGDTQHYDALLNYMSKNNMKLPKTYDYIQQQMDMNEFMNYEIAKIYFASEDWPQNNVKFWRPKMADGRWRWILFDNESGFGIWWPYTHNTLDSASKSGQWSTFLLYKLLDNPTFRNEFIQRFAAHINSTFHPERVRKLIDAMQAVLEPEMPRQIARWGNSGAEGWGYQIYRSMSDWKKNIDLMRTFAVQRPAIMRNHILGKFKLSGTVDLTLQTLPDSGSGRIYVNSVLQPEGPITGKYFKDIPLQLQAVPNSRYRFVGWQGLSDTNSDTDYLSLLLTQSSTWTAVFEKKENPTTLIPNWAIHEIK